MDRRYFLHYGTVSAVYILTGCSGDSDETKKSQNSSKTTSDSQKKLSKNQNVTKSVAPFTQQLKLPSEINFSKVAKAQLTAQKSKVNFFENTKTDVLTFQGELPNPTIRISKGDDFAINFTNKLQKPTIIHWHGLIVPEEMDGHPKDVIANGKTKNYHYPVEQNAGTFWYHTHPHGRTGKQIYHGLLGFYIIEDEKEKSLNLPKGEFELPLLIQDKRFDKNNQLLYKDPNFPQDNNGLLGDTVLVNATPSPYHSVKTGKYRLRILNASSVRTYKLTFDTIDEFTIIGTDAGLLEKPQNVNSVVLSVAERVDIIVDFKDKKIGDKVILKTLGLKEASNVGLHPDYPDISTPMDIMQFHVDEEIQDKYELPKKLVDITRMKESKAVKTRTITMQINSKGLWTLDNKVYDIKRIDQRIKLGDTEIWELKNTVHMAHPFHIHGVRFQVLDRDGKMTFPTDKGWKDTVLVMPNETVRIIVEFTMPGLFLYHCHILEHEDRAMMANLLVE
jgi:FtsP/CotA-like multicopper oxidase with cupredoxin domain